MSEWLTFQRGRCLKALDHRISQMLLEVDLVHFTLDEWFMIWEEPSGLWCRMPSE